MHATTPCSPPSPWRIALAGAVALAAVMGLGRFAFTPMLALMVEGGLLDLHEGSWLATLNYIGYLLGALLCMALPWLLRRHGQGRVRALSPALMLTALLTTAALLAAMAWPAPWLWRAARALAGVASGIGFVHTAGWCLEQLALRQAPKLGGLIFTGPGLGIVASGLVASLLARLAWPPWAIWAALAALGLAMAAWVAQVVRQSLLWPPAPAAAAAPDAEPAAPHTPDAPWRWEHGLLAAAYGLAGLGYIITATYLPVIAQLAIPGSPWIGLFWPVFGVCVAIGAASTGWISPQADRRWLLMACYLVQALGVALPLWWPHSLGFVLGSVLLGLPFTVITLFGMQEARRLRPGQATAFMGALTMLYGLGQIAGPPLVVRLMGWAGDAQRGFALALGAAALSLLAGAALYGVMLGLERAKRQNA